MLELSFACDRLDNFRGFGDLVCEHRHRWFVWIPYLPWSSAPPSPRLERYRSSNGTGSTDRNTIDHDGPSTRSFPSFVMPVPHTVPLYHTPYLLARSELGLELKIRRWNRHAQLGLNVDMAVGI